MKVTVKTEGFAEMDRALGEFKTATGKNILRRAGVKSMRPMAQTMASKAPVQKGGDEDLKKSIDVATKLNKRQRRINRSPSTVEVYVGPTAPSGENPGPQGPQQEFGNEHHGPQPFARPTWDVGQGALLGAVRTNLGAEIEEGRKRAARRALKPKKG